MPLTFQRVSIRSGSKILLPNRLLLASLTCSPIGLKVFFQIIVFNKVIVDGISSTSFLANAGVPNGSVIFPTLFLNYISIPKSIDTNPVHRYNNRINVASSINFNPYSLKKWGFQNLVNFGADKTQCCYI